MKWYVYWDYGSCNDGSHSCGLQDFAMEVEARKEAEEHVKRMQLEGGGTVILMQGNIVQKYGS